MPYLVGSDELLPPAEDEPDRTPGPAGQRRHVGLEMELALAAEAAPQVGHDDPDPAFGDAQGLGHPAAGQERDLRGGPDGDLVALPLGQDGVRLDGDGVRHVDPVALLEHHGRSLQPHLHVALDDVDVGALVAPADDSIQALVRLPLGVDQRTSGVEGALGVEDGLQRFVLDLDQAGSRGCRLLGEGGDRGHHLALEAHHAAGEKSAVGDRVAVAHVGHVVLGDRRQHARMPAGSDQVQPADPGVRPARVDELGVEHPRQRQVGGVARLAQDLLQAVGAPARGPDRDRHQAPTSRREKTSSEMAMKASR